MKKKTMVTVDMKEVDMKFKVHFRLWPTRYFLATGYLEDICEVKDGVLCIVKKNWNGNEYYWEEI